jgi:GNAT superfamily N-acetyltransferase
MHTVELTENGKLVAWADIYGNSLETIAVEPEFRGLGYGLQILGKVMLWMKSKNIKKLTFLDSADGFWQAAKRHYPRNVFINQNMEGMIVA